MASLPQEWQKDYALMIKLYACYVDGFNAGMNVPLKEVSKEEVSRMDIIFNEVTHFLRVQQKEIASKSRRADIVYARHLGMYFAKKHTRANLSIIGKTFGNREHSTVLYAVKCIENYLDSDHKKKIQINTIESRILTKIREIS